jgi:ketosteroid isomerase-like protein
LTASGGGAMTARMPDPRRVVLDFVDRINAGDVAAALALVDEDATWWLPPSLPVAGGLHRGRDAILHDFMLPVGMLFAEGRPAIDVRGTTVEGGRVAVEWVARATSHAGVPYENHYHVLFEVRDGRIRAVREYMDALAVQRAFFPA